MWDLVPGLLSSRCSAAFDMYRLGCSVHAEDVDGASSKEAKDAGNCETGM